MAYHQHVQMLVHCVSRKRHCRVRRRRKNVRKAANANDVGSVPATSAFSMIGVNRTVLERGNCVLDKTGFVKCVRMDRYLDVEFLGNTETLIDCGWGRSPVLMQFQPE